MSEKWSAFPAGTAVQPTDNIVGLQSGANVKWTGTQLQTFVWASPTLVTPVIGVATGTSLALGAGAAVTSTGVGGALGSNAFTSTAYAPLASPTFTGTVTMPDTSSFTSSAVTLNTPVSVVSSSFGLSGNFNGVLGTAGLRYKNVPATITDTTTGAGTIATAYTDVFGGNTIASTNAITVTNYATMYVKAPTAGSGITFTNKSAIAADSISIGGAAQGSNALAVTGLTNLNGGSLGASSTSNFLNVNGTWNDGGTAFKAALLINVTNTASSIASLLLDTQVGGVSQFSVQRNGLVEATNNFETTAGSRFSYAGRSRIASPSAGFFTLYDVSEVQNATLGAPSTATLQLGAANAASPVAQTLQAQGSRAGTDTNVAGANLTVQAGTGTGTGASSKLLINAPIGAASGTGAQTQTLGLTVIGAANGQLPSVIIGGSAANATNATDGFLYIPTTAGQPTGTPTTQGTGTVAIQYDTTNHQFWIYDGGWKQPKTPAAAATVTWQ